ncbi:hypothetical protein [Nonomuraea sp. NPDC003709]|uniref:hypothetical protein n=1 Tax=Nonomuraea sp. NPDC003709 TaxID=3154450 RepID=UPI0033A82708
MTNNVSPSPIEDQWGFLSSHGFSARFAGTWVEGSDPESAAHILRADPASRLDCDFETAMQWYDPYSSEEIVWVGVHAPEWLHIISLSGVGIAPGPLSADGRRLFYLEYDDGEGGVHGLSYWRDGKGRGQYGRNSNTLGELEVLFNRHNVDATAAQDDESELNSYLHLLGHVTGRFIDQDWLMSPRTLYRIPDDAWSW